MFAEAPDELGSISERSSAITHADPRCRRGCAVLNYLIAGLVTGTDDPLAAALAATYPDQTTAQEIDDALAPVPGELDRTNVQNTSYVVDTLQAAVYYALTASDAESAIVRAVNAGGDADTVGAVTGAIVGARFGCESLPERWIDEIDENEELTHLADALIER